MLSLKKRDSALVILKGTLAAHILGGAGVDNQGLSGIEYELEDLLVGEDGRIVGEYDANNNPHTAS